MKNSIKFDTDAWLKQWQEMFAFVPFKISSVLEAVKLSNNAQANKERWDLLQQWLAMGQRLWLHLVENYTFCPNCKAEKGYDLWFKLARQGLYCNCSGSSRNVLMQSFDQDGNQVIAVELENDGSDLIIYIEWDLLTPETELTLDSAEDPEVDLASLDDL